MVDLLPCPFCGGKAMKYVGVFEKNMSYIKCESCDVQTAKYYDREEAVRVWNRRTK